MKKSIEIHAADIKNLRNETGYGMMDCKKALVKANGNYKEALNILTKPIEVEVFCDLCGKSIGVEEFYFEFCDRYHNRYCDSCKATLEEERRAREKAFKEKKKREEEEYKKKMDAHWAEMDQLKNTNPVGYMSVYYSVCRDCPMTSKCSNCSLKFCVVCDKKPYSCDKCSQTKDDKTLKFLKKTLKDYSKLFVKVPTNETTK